MPLLKYFAFVGCTLLVLLFVLNWFIPPSTEVALRSGVDRPVIRISSIERLPDAVVIDTSCLPTIVPSPSPSPTESLEQLPPLSVVENDERATPAANKIAAHPTKQKQIIAKREAAKKNAAHRTSPPVHLETAPYRSGEAAGRVTRMSLLDVLKERLGQTFFKLN